MKTISKISVISILISLLAFTSCKNELEINGPLDSKLAVYGLINWTDTAHYFKIYKTFLTEDNIYVAAQNMDNYLLYDSIEVMLIENNNSGVLKYHLFDTTTSIPKESGIFSNPNNPNRQVLYVNRDFLSPTSTYELQIKNRYTGSIMATSGCSANCSEKDLIKLPYPETYGTPGYNPSDPLRFASKEINCAKADPEYTFLTRASIKFTTKLMNVFNENNKKTFKVNAYFNFFYWEKENFITNPNDSVLKGPIKTYIGSIATNVDAYYYTEIEWNPSSFFSNLKNQLPSLGTNAYRGSGPVHFYFWVAGKEYAEFIANNNQASLSIIEDRPTLTNISNGVGLFSSRYLLRMSDWYLSSATRDALINHPDLKTLGFKF